MENKYLRTVTGQKDPVIKMLRDLQTIEGRTEHNCYFAEGEELVKRAFEYGGTVKYLLLTDKYCTTESGAALQQTALRKKTQCYICTSGLLSKILDAKPIPECLIALERNLITTADSFVTARLVLVIESCENADNLGMLLRCADASGVGAVVLAGSTVEPYNRRTVRGSRGAVFSIPLCIEPDSQKLIDEARSAGFKVISSSANSELTHTEVDMSGKTAVVVGNEHTGITQTLWKSSDAVVRIPMFGRINSLNIATAASVLLYEQIRQSMNCREIQVPNN